MYSQNDKRWKHKPLNNSKTITIGSHGCLLTTFCNIINNRYKKERWTPLTLNKELIIQGGYTSGNLIIWDKIESILGCKCYPWYTEEIKYSLTDYYIANYLHYGAGHFVNLVEINNGKYKIFNVWNGEIEEIEKPRRISKVSFL
jgi:hypothetical protein